MSDPLDPALEKGLELARQSIDRLKASGVSEYELFLNRSSATSIASKDQKVESLTRAEDVGLSIRLKRQNRIGFSFNRCHICPVDRIRLGLNRSACRNQPRHISPANRVRLRLDR